VSQKRIADIIGRILKKDEQILIVFGTNAPDTTEILLQVTINNVGDFFATQCSLLDRAVAQRKLSQKVKSPTVSQKRIPDIIECNLIIIIIIIIIRLIRRRKIP